MTTVTSVAPWACSQASSSGTKPLSSGTPKPAVSEFAEGEDADLGRGRARSDEREARREGQAPPRRRRKRDWKAGIGQPPVVPRARRGARASTLDAKPGARSTWPDAVADAPEDARRARSPNCYHRR